MQFALEGNHPAVMAHTEDELRDVIDRVPRPKVVVLDRVRAPRIFIGFTDPAHRSNIATCYWPLSCRVGKILTERLWLAENEPMRAFLLPGLTLNELEGTDLRSAWEPVCGEFPYIKRRKEQANDGPCDLEYQKDV